LLIFGRSYGIFERYFTLPRSADPSKITANFRDGVLTLTMPKLEEAQPQKIRIYIE